VTAPSIRLHNLWGSQSWLSPAISRREDYHKTRKSRLKGGCRQDCLPHSLTLLVSQLLNLNEVLNK
jgi:hypothetical protein